MTAPSLNALDRAVGWFSPASGARRARARAAIHLLGYEGATNPRSTTGWIAAGSSANAEVGKDLSSLRARAHDLVRNNPAAAHAATLDPAYVVGTGIIARADSGDAGLDKAIQARWDPWYGSTDCDADGMFDGYGGQALMERARFEGGEALIRFRYRDKADFPELDFPLQLQYLESEFLDHARNGTFGGVEKGHRVLFGVELDRRENRVAFWLHTVHPGDGAAGLSIARQSIRIPAREVVHYFLRQRPGQQRAVSDLAPILIPIKELAQLNRALVVRAMMEACMGVGIETSSEAPATATEGVADETPQFEPGMFFKTQPGDTVKFNEPTSGGGHVEFREAIQRDFATGLHLLYSDISGDLSKTSFTSLRGGGIPMRRIFEQRRWHHFIPTVCQRTWDEFIRVGATIGAFGKTFDPRKKIPVVWHSPRWEYVNPADDVAADIEEVRAGFSSWSAKVAERGENPVDVLDRIEDDQKEFDRRKITVISDGRVPKPEKSAPAPKGA